MIKLSDLLFGISIKSVVGDITSVMVKKVEFDSRKVSDLDLFIAIKGVNVDGHSFIDSSIVKGAKSILVEKDTLLKDMQNQLSKEEKSEEEETAD